MFLTISLFAQKQDNNSTADAKTLEDTLKKEPSFFNNLFSLDYIQSNISKKVLIFSSNLDHTVKNWVKKDTNSSSKEVKEYSEEEKKAYSLYSVVRLYDDFFKDESYLSTTNRSYIRLRWGGE
jgi:hypothetical protein